MALKLHGVKVTVLGKMGENRQKEDYGAQTPSFESHNTRLHKENLMKVKAAMLASEGRDTHVGKMWIIPNLINQLL